ncbi:MAG: tRNA pseudouridine(55) synthase TruB [Clostridia bacterium]|nr:tRNA pseudouridine(55) synthase TruB [Clostridia bacterium]
MTGFINLNKSAGASSAKEVSVIKRLTKTPCGHMGTLDPMASGVLPVAIGNAARLFDYFSNKRKKYIATFRFGADSDTLDTTGVVQNNAGRIPSKEEIEEVLPMFLGKISQVPPRYSAKNISGKRGYELARAGVEFSLPPKTVEIYTLKVFDNTLYDCYDFEIECGGGTYIRSIARDIAQKLGTCAVMSSLIRTQSGVFSIENSVKSEDLTEENFKDFIIPTESLLPFDSIYPDERTGFKLFNGLAVSCEKQDGVYKIYRDGLFYGLAEVKQSILKVRTKLC